MPDENNITFSYQIDVEGLVRWLYDHVVGFFYTGDFDSFYTTLADIWYFFSIASFALSALLLTGIIYAKIRYSQVSEQEQALLREAERAYNETRKAGDENVKWQQVLAHAGSENPNDWRLAIIEADIMLDDLLESVGYTGMSIGEKLKSARPEVFKTVQDAWDAHKVRNQIAHRGSDFVLTKRATQQAIAQYERVFREFEHI